MKKIIILFLLATFIFISNNAIKAEEVKKIEKVDYSLDLAYMGNYIWRGMNVTDDSVFQPSITATYKSWSFNIWGNMDMTDINKRSKEFTEVDYTIDYGWKKNRINYNLGVIRYAFPKASASNTTEIYGTIAYNSLLNPFITLYNDVDLINSPYLLTGISKTCGKVDIATSVGYGSKDYNKAYFGVAKEAFTDFNLSFSVPVKMSKNWTMTTSLNFSSVLNKDLRRGRKNNDNIWAGINWSKNF